MASAGQAQAHSSHPMHFSSPSGCRLSTCRPWYRGAVGCLSSGYSSVTGFLNVVRNVTPKPATGAKRSLRAPRDLSSRLSEDSARSSRGSVTAHLHGRRRHGAGGARPVQLGDRVPPAGRFHGLLLLLLDGLVLG